MCLQLNKILVFGDHDRPNGAGLLKDLGVCGGEQPQVSNVDGPNLSRLFDPSADRRRELCIHPGQHGVVGVGHLGSQGRVVEAPRRIEQACRDVLRLQVRKIGQYLRLTLPRCQEFEDVNYANPHAPDTRASTTLSGIDRDPVE